MKRAYIVTLAAVGAMLVADGPPQAEAARSVSPFASAPETQARIARIVQARNSVLSDAESLRIGRAVARSAARHGLDPDLVTAVLIVESGARPWARSGKGAVGLMQVMPHMVRQMSLAGNLATVEANVEAGCAILADNIARLGEDDGISAYFWGSNIRGVAYLDRVRAARAALRQSSES